LASSLDRISPHAEHDAPLAATAFAELVPQQAPGQARSPDRSDGGSPPSPQPPHDIARYVATIRALADAGELDPAAAQAAAAIQAYPLAAELHYMRAVVLTGLGQGDAATTSLRRVIYLDPSLAVAHFTLGSILWRSGAVADARRCYRNALALAAARPPRESLALSEGETAGRMTEAARNQLAFIDGGVETMP
jgi:chemotaxis protein methyltransferase CheR